jgi:hypothetical protein
MASLGATDDEVIAHSARQPRLGTPMWLIDHGVFVAQHDDHHFTTITELAEFWGLA